MELWLGKFTIFGRRIFEGVLFCLLLHCCAVFLKDLRAVLLGGIEDLWTKKRLKNTRFGWKYVTLPIRLKQDIKHINYKTAMKKFLLVLLAGALVVSCNTGKKTTYKYINERDVPERYVKDFSRLRPGALQPSWMQVDTLTYGVQFVENENNIEMHFSKTGVETYWQIPLQYTPDNITEYINTEYAGYKLKDLKLTDIRNQKGYRAMIVKKKETKYLDFDLQGNFNGNVEESSK